jgi:predicted dehydrogenase
VTTVGLVGAGRWGRNIRRDLEDLGAEVLVADPDPAVGATAPELSALPPVDGVVVATPASTHAAVVAEALERQVPVFCEKPFTTDVASARELAARGGDRLHLMHVWRYHPGVEALGDLARSGDLGRPLGLRSTRVNGPSPRRDVDSTWTLVPHDLTIAIEVLGAIPPPRAALVEEVGGRAESLWGLCGDDPWLVVEASTRFADKRREVRLHAEDGVAVLPHDGATALRIERGEGVAEQAFRPEPPLRRELAAFLDHLRGGPPPKSDAAEGVAVVEALVALRELAGR